MMKQKWNNPFSRVVWLNERYKPLACLPILFNSNLGSTLVSLARQFQTTKLPTWYFLSLFTSTNDIACYYRDFMKERARLPVPTSSTTNQTWSFGSIDSFMAPPSKCVCWEATCSNWSKIQSNDIVPKTHQQWKPNIPWARRNALISYFDKK